MAAYGIERQLTHAPHGHILTHSNVWTHDGQALVYDVRSDAAGSLFDGNRIEKVHLQSLQTELLYKSQNGAHCGVVTTSPVDSRFLFIQGPEFPDAEWSYSACHRQGILLDVRNTPSATIFDARDMLHPRTAGALSGGTHLHTFDSRGERIAFTYEDAHLAKECLQTGHANLRNVGICIPNQSVQVPKNHPRNHHGSHYSLLITQAVWQAEAGSDQYERAAEEAWLPQHSAIAFQGVVRLSATETHKEIYIAWLDTVADTIIPQIRIERLTRRPAGRGLTGPRHWLEGSPDGKYIAGIFADNYGIDQLWLFDLQRSELRQLTSNPYPITSAFTWSADSQWLAHAMHQQICVTNCCTGNTYPITPEFPSAFAPRPEAVVFSPDGAKIAYVRPVRYKQNYWNQLFTCSLPAGF